MDEQKFDTHKTEADRAGELKTCPRCGGTWPASRRHCIACGASLAEVPLTPAREATRREKIDWRWLDLTLQEESADDEAGVATKATGDARPGQAAYPDLLRAMYEGILGFFRRILSK